LEYSIKDVQACEKEITVKIGEEIIKDAKNEFFDEVGKDAKIQGFRQGKVPREVIEEKYADQAKEDALKKIVNFAVRKISGEEKLELLTYPNIKDVQYTETSLVFKVDVELQPVVEVKNYTGLKVKKEPIQIDDKELNDVLENVRESFAKFEVVDRVSELGDYLIADYETQFGDQPKEDHKEEMVQVQDNKFLVDFAQNLIGLKPGDKKDFSVPIANDHPNDQLKGKKAQFSLTVKEVKVKKTPELNDDLAKQAGNYENLDALKKSVKEDITKKKEQEQQNKTEKALLDQLLSKNPFETSRGVIQRHLNQMVEDSKQRMLQMGYPKEEVDKQDDKMKEEYKKEAANQVRLAFILEGIAKKEKLNIEEKDIQNEMQQLSLQNRVPVEKVKEHFSSEENLNMLINRILNQKVLHFLKDKAIIE